MPNRTAKFTSAILVSVFAGMTLTTMSHGATPAADDCLSAPKDQTPQGSHWYYRIDRPTKRHCWYLRDDRETLSQVAPQNSAPAVKPVPPKTEATVQRSIANARAELPLPQTRAAQDTGAATGRLTLVTAADAALPATDEPANARDTNIQQSAVASRWPDQSDVSSSADPAPATSSSDASVQPTSDPAPPDAIAPVTLAAADASSEKTDTQSGSIQTLLLVVIGALSLAGLMGSAIIRFGSTQRAGRHAIRVDRRAIWDSAGTDRLPRPDRLSARAFPASSERPRRVDTRHELATAIDEPDDRIAEMLARLARSAKT
jgi:hypothetical protein